MIKIKLPGKYSVMSRFLKCPLDEDECAGGCRLGFCDERQITKSLPDAWVQNT